jgi:uncharacterized protein
MPRAPADPVEVDRLAAQGATLERDWPASAFERLADRLADPAGQVAAALSFHRVDGFAAVQGRVRADLHLQCQRCLSTFEWPLDTTLKLCFVADEGAAARVPGEYEPALAPGGRAQLASLVEEEVLLALPLVPVHADPARCEARGVPEVAAAARAGRTDALEAPAAEVQRPFANLRDWLVK